MEHVKPYAHHLVLSVLRCPMRWLSLWPVASPCAAGSIHLPYAQIYIVHQCRIAATNKYSNPCNRECQAIYASMLSKNQQYIIGEKACSHATLMDQRDR